MNKSVKAAILSGLVFPGLGQLYLKQHKKGWIIITVVSLSIVVIVGMATHTAYKILNEDLQHGMVDIERIVQLAERYSHGHDFYYYASMILILCCWIYGIIDSLCYKEK